METPESKQYDDATVQEVADFFRGSPDDFQVTFGFETLTVSQLVERIEAQDEIGVVFIERYLEEKKTREQ